MTRKKCQVQKQEPSCCKYGQTNCTMSRMGSLYSVLSVPIPFTFWKHKNNGNMKLVLLSKRQKWEFKIFKPDCVRPGENRSQAVSVQREGITGLHSQSGNRRDTRTRVHTYRSKDPPAQASKVQLEGLRLQCRTIQGHMVLSEHWCSIKSISWLWTMAWARLLFQIHPPESY